MDYAKKVEEQLQEQGVRVQLDVRDEKLGYKIREAQTKKVPYALVLGDAEMSEDAVNVRKYGEKDTETIGLSDFIDQIKNQISQKS